MQLEEVEDIVDDLIELFNNPKYSIDDNVIYENKYQLDLKE